MRLTQERMMDLINLADTQMERMNSARETMQGLSSIANRAYTERNNAAEVYECFISLCQTLELALAMPYQEVSILAREKAHFQARKSHNERSKLLMQRRRYILSTEKLDLLYDNDPESEQVFKQIETETQELKQEKTFAILPPSAEELWTKIKSVWRNHMPFIDGGSIASLSPTTEPELIQTLIDTLAEDGRLKPGQFPGEYIPQTETLSIRPETKGFA